MRSKTLILMFVAIGCGLVASYMTSRLIADRGKENEEEKVTVLVARQNITMGTLLKEPEQLFEEKQFTKGEEPKRAIRTFDELRDRRMNKPIGAEQFVTPDDVIDKSQDGFAYGLPKGKRAISFKVNVDTIVGGFVLPHSHVDIVSVIKRNEEQFSRIILQNVLVLAVDTMDRRPDDKQAVVSSTVTVMVTPTEAEKISLATELGTLRLILRPFGDEEKVVTPGITPKNVVQASDGKSDDPLGGGDKVVRLPGWTGKIPDVPPPPKVVAKAPEPPPPPKTHTMTIYNGESVTQAIFTLGEKDKISKTQIERSKTELAPGSKSTPSPSPAK
jgi:pilus assembly protein CpaB